jgi:hypothetical protein
MINGGEMQTIKTIVYGVGAMGSNMVRLLQRKPFSRLAGAVDWDEKKIGRDVGDVAGLGRPLGIKVAYPPDEVLGKIDADVVLLATTAFIDEAYPIIVEIIKQNINVITIAQELFFPLPHHAPLAKEIDQLARMAGVCVTSVGINPGFIMDIIPIVASLPCWTVNKVKSERIVDFSPYGPDEMRHIGAGLTPQEFSSGVSEGKIGHIGLLETAAMVSNCLGLGVDELNQKKSAIITNKVRQSHFIKILSGRVCGFRQKVVGTNSGKVRLDLSMVGLVCPDPEEDQLTLGDYTRIEGEPSVDVAIKEEISQKGGLGTAGVAVNMIPRVLASAPGFHTMNELALPHIWHNQEHSIQRITYF